MPELLDHTASQARVDHTGIGGLNGARIVSWEVYARSCDVFCSDSVSASQVGRLIRAELKPAGQQAGSKLRKQKHSETRHYTNGRHIVNGIS